MYGWLEFMARHLQQTTYGYLRVVLRVHNRERAWTRDIWFNVPILTDVACEFIHPHNHIDSHFDHRFIAGREKTTEWLLFIIQSTLWVYICIIIYTTTFMGLFILLLTDIKDIWNLNQFCKPSVITCFFTSFMTLIINKIKRSVISYWWTCYLDLGQWCTRTIWKHTIKVSWKGLDSSDRYLAQ